MATLADVPPNDGTRTSASSRMTQSPTGVPSNGASSMTDTTSPLARKVTRAIPRPEGPSLLLQEARLTIDSRFVAASRSNTAGSSRHGHSYFRSERSGSHSPRHGTHPLPGLKRDSIGHAGETHPHPSHSNPPAHGDGGLDCRGRISAWRAAFDAAGRLGSGEGEAGRFPLVASARKSAATGAAGAPHASPKHAIAWQALRIGQFDATVVGFGGL
jgi:hypothetical protein